MIDDKRMDPGFPFCPWLDALIDAGIEEDVAAGDVTTELAIDPRRRAVASVVARSRGVMAGLPLLEPIFSRLSTGIVVDAHLETTAPGVYAAGDVTGRDQFVYMAAYAAKLAPTLGKDKILLVSLSGRGDKDMHTVAEKSGIQF